MCTDCGCNIKVSHTTHNGDNATVHNTRHSLVTVDVHQRLLLNNDEQALKNRARFTQHNVMAINLMSSPGSGKTSLLEKTIDELKPHYNIAVIEGDLETENDARRIRAKGIDTIQITTGCACHLDAFMVNNALSQLKLESVDLLFIENVGNLVCPASFDLGQHHNVTLLSTTEGDDKPEKYPVIFRAADLTLISKCDLLPFLDGFDPLRARQSLEAVAGSTPLLKISARNGEGIDQWLDWLQQSISKTGASI